MRLAVTMWDPTAPETFPNPAAYHDAMITRRGVVAAVLLLLLHSGARADEPKASGGGAASHLKPCHVPDLDEEVLCGRYEVYENRAARKRRKIALNIVVLPAKGPEVASDP